MRDEAEEGMKNYADRGGCCNTLQNLHNSNYWSIINAAF